MKRPKIFSFLLLPIFVVLVGCQEGEEMKAVENLDLERFMGDWHVIANIPTFVEKNTINNLESYRLREDGNVDITFSLTTTENERKRHQAKGFVLNKEQPSQWKVQFFWPIKFPFYVIELDADYSYTVIGLPNRKYAWIMAREPMMDDKLYEDILVRLADIGYNVEQIQKVPYNPERKTG